MILAVEWPFLVTLGAFGAVLGIFWLMIARPALGW